MKDLDTKYFKGGIVEEKEVRNENDLRGYLEPSFSFPDLSSLSTLTIIEELGDIETIKTYQTPTTGTWAWEELPHERFNNLKDEWKEKSKYLSSPQEMAMLESYQEIIGMGTLALPLILEELRNNVDHWFWALSSITGKNPIKEEDLGNLNKMAESWIEWGLQNNIIEDLREANA